MRSWLVRADQADNSLFGLANTATHRVPCLCWRDRRCDWNTAQAGDQVALVRVRNRNTYHRSRYTPGVVAFGHILNTEASGPPSENRRAARIAYHDFFFDTPVSLHWLARTSLFQTVMFQMSQATCGTSSPMPLSEQQWTTIADQRHRVSRVAPRTRWDISPGTTLNLAELHDEHPLNQVYGYNKVFNPDGTLANLHESQAALVLVSNLTPNLFVVTDASARNARPAPEKDGSVLVWVRDHHGYNRILEHIAAGRALRVVTRANAASTTIRYAGQYVIDQRNPIVADPPASKADGHCLRLHPCGPVCNEPELWQPRVGQRYRAAPAPDSPREAALSPSFQRHINAAKLRVAIRTHRELQNQLADQISAYGLRPLAPNPDEPQFDLAFWRGHKLVVCEVKSLPAASEDDQLRYGLGQVGHYAEHYRRRGEEVHPVLYVQHQPRDPLWQPLCHRHGVTLAWPDTIHRILDQTDQHLGEVDRQA
jgi:hypothetical protein